jgi:hypothetical protein
MVPLAKGAEVFYSYMPALGSKADRQKLLNETGGFLCRCEMCTLPDYLSDALDTKIKIAIGARLYINQMLDGTHNDYVGGARCIETLITEERIFSANLLLMSTTFFVFFRRRRLLKEVGQVLVPILERYWGSEPGIGEQPADSLSRLLKNPPDWHSGEHGRLRVSNLGEEFQARLGEVASNIIAILKRLP